MSWLSGLLIAPFAGHKGGTAGKDKPFTFLSARLSIKLDITTIAVITYQLCAHCFQGKRMLEDRPLCFCRTNIQQEANPSDISYYKPKNTPHTLS